MCFLQLISLDGVLMLVLEHHDCGNGDRA
jgi:hypothetical protein